MKNQLASLPSSTSLETVLKELSKLRESTGGKRVREYPASFRRMVIGCLEEGMSIAKIAKATGLATSVIFGWRKAAEQLPPERALRELKLVASPAMEVPEARHRKATITLPSGIAMELDVRDINEVLVSALCRLR